MSEDRRQESGIAHDTLFDKLQKNWRYYSLFFFVGFAIAFLLAVSGWSPASFNVGPFEFPIETTADYLKIQVPIAIDSQKDWQFTGVGVERGDRIVVEIVSGAWTPASGPLSSNAREKVADDIGYLETYVNYFFETKGTGGGMSCFDADVEGCPLPDVQIGHLIAKIGLSGSPFAIESQKSFVAEGDGVLYLRINDGTHLSDNRGVLGVTIINEQ